MIELHGIIREISFLYSMQSIAAIDSYMVHTCKYYTAVRKKTYINYKDPESDCQRQQRGPYGRKCRRAIDVDSLLF